jgi:hypothetical protein
MGIRNWMKIILAFTPLPPFTTAKETWNKLFAIFFLKCILNLNTYPWIKRMSKSNHYYLKYGGWRLGQGNVYVCSLAPPPVRQRKMIRGIPNIFLENVSIFKIYQWKNKSKANHFSSRYGGSNIWKEIPNIYADAKTPVRTSVCQRKSIKDFCKFPFAVHSWLKYLSMK